jgi:hypothetical protein
MNVNKEQLVAFINRVNENKGKYTDRDYSRAIIVRCLKHILGYSSTQNFKTILKESSQTNCPITHIDIVAAEKSLDLRKWH